MVLAKAARHEAARPRRRASPPALRADPDVDAAEVAGPGFINLRLKPAYWHGALQRDRRRRRRLTAVRRWAAARRSMSNMSRPTRPGRCMSAIAAARCSATRSPICSPSAGYEVTREYYINDAGAQVDVLARSAYLRYREALGETIGDIPEGLYPGDYLKPVGEALAARARPRAARHEPRPTGCRSSATPPSTTMMEMIRDDLARSASSTTSSSPSGR